MRLSFRGLRALSMLVDKTWHVNLYAGDILVYIIPAFSQAHAEMIERAVNYKEEGPEYEI